ncbi:AMP phosphorylase [Candidatus Pacearchaeota archaeon]|nr:AMP phosphorylase [Candidatus Pacearchaeota archaeon]
MKLKVKELRFMAGRPIAILNSWTANHMNVHVGERINLSKYSDDIVSIVDVSRDLISNNEVAVSQEILESLNIREGDEVDVSPASKPTSAFYIKKKMDGLVLNKDEIHTIIEDIVNNALTEAEIAYFVAAVYKNKMTAQETEALISSMVSVGKRLSFPGVVADKHSIGGIAANRTTPIVVSICVAAGLTMPKTSSRAITSAAGTADVIESIARVEFTTEELKKIISKVGGCMVWNGVLGLSPADDKLIQTERILGLDPEAQLLASVLSKKIAVGSKYVLIDIPFGESAKVDKKRALDLKKKFEFFGKKFGLNLKCVLTNGEQPIGRGIGPLLEIRDVIRVLKQEDSPKDLENKALFLASELLELSGKCKKGKGYSLAKEILTSGKAFHKFQSIIEAQSGKVPTIKEIEQRLGKHKKDILAPTNMKIKSINNKKINAIASSAGCPMDKGSGIYLYKHVGDNVKKGEKILTIYSESKNRLEEALDLYKKINALS